MSKDKDFKQSYKIADELDKTLPDWKLEVEKRFFYATLKPETLSEISTDDPIYIQMKSIYAILKPLDSVL